MYLSPDDIDHTILEKNAKATHGQYTRPGIPLDNEHTENAACELFETRKEEQICKYSEQTLVNHWVGHKVNNNHAIYYESKVPRVDGIGNQYVSSTYAKFG